MANTTAQMANPAFQAVYSESRPIPALPPPLRPLRDVSTDSFANPPEFRRHHDNRGGIEGCRRRHRRHPQWQLGPRRPGGTQPDPEIHLRNLAEIRRRSRAGPPPVRGEGLRPEVCCRFPKALQDRRQLLLRDTPHRRLEDSRMIRNRSHRISGLSAPYRRLCRVPSRGRWWRRSRCR